MLGISLPGLGDIAEKICDSVLPKELRIVGDVVGGIVNFETGNYAGALRQGMEMFGDLKDLQQSLGKSQLQDNAGGRSWSYEPSPPESRQNKQISDDKSTEVAKGWRANSEKLKRTSTEPQQATEWRGSPPATDASKPATPNATAKPGETKEPKAPKETKETKEPKTTTESKSKTETNKVVEDFFKKSPDDFMQAIRDGKIPEEIKKSPEQMQRLQAKMNQISEMNQLMTALLAALHQMQMAIIQNVRV